MLSNDRLAVIRARAEWRTKVHEAVRGPEDSVWHHLMTDNNDLLAEVERLRARDAALVEVVEQVAALWVMDDCSHGNDFPQRRISLYDKTEDGIPVIDVAAVREQARALLASADATTAE